MPPQHPQTGDVLDKALAVARTQKPAATGFFNALKPNSNQFAQTSRVNVARPAAQQAQQARVVPAPQERHPFLGGNGTTAATPAEQSFLARQNATDKTAAAPIRRQATTIAQNYVKGSDTQKPKGGIPGAALSAPADLAVAQRGLQLIGSHVPLGSAAAPFLQALSKLHLSAPASQQVIGGIAHDPTIERKDVAGDLAALAIARGNSIPAHPTTSQLLTAAIAPHQHHGSYWDAVNPVNIAKDAIYTPLYTAQGGFALGHATREALPSALGGKGDTTALKAIGESQLQTFEHPGAFVQQHPFQAALAAIGAAKTAGGIAGRIAKLPETERNVTLSNFAGSPINRGTLDQNLVTRGAQKLSDTLLANAPKSAQGSALANRLQGAAVRIQRDRALENRKAFTEYRDAGRAIGNRREKQFLLQNASQGLTPAEREAFYKSLPETANRTAEANVANAQGKTFGNGPLTPKQQRYVDAARGLAKRRTQQNLDSGNLTPEAALRRDFQPMIHQRASVGDPTASNIIRVEGELRGWMKQATPKDPQLRAYRDQRIADLSAEHDGLVKQFAGEQQGAEPFRVPMQKPTVKSKFAYPGRAVRANANLKVSGIGNERTFGDQLRSGNFIQNNEGFERQLFEPGTAADARKFVHEVSDPNSGLGAVHVHNGQELTDQQLQNYELLNRDNLRTKPKNADKTIDAADAKTTEAEITRLGTDLNAAWTEPELGLVPSKGDFVLVPKPVRAQLDKTVSRVRPGSAQQRIEQAGHAFKTGVLMTRPTYPLTNLVGNMIQALPENVGVGSYAKALRHSVPLPSGVHDAGFIAREFGHDASKSFGSLIDEGKPIAAINHVTLGGYVRTIRNASIAVDNFVREAVYSKVATKEAKKLAGYNQFQRVFKPADAAVKDWLQKMANGDTPEARTAAAKALRTVNDLQGEYDQMRSNGVIDAVVPFHRWLQFISKLMFKTLPLKYPGKTLAAYDLGNIGQQAAGQKGALPQYLADTIDLKGTPLARLQADFTKTNPLTTFGSMFQPGKTGDPNLAGAFGSLSPYFGIGYGLATGKDFQSGRPLLNGQGKPLLGLGDNLRYLGSQVAGFVPPLGALAGGQAGQADTSIPLPGMRQPLPPKADGTPRTNALPGPTWDLPLVGKVPLIPLINQVIPFRLQVRNQQADQLKGFTNTDALLKKALQDDIKAHITGNTPAEKRASEAKLVAKWQKIEAVAAAKRDYFAKNPKALDALIASGTAK